jgi:hypothetical protein
MIDVAGGSGSGGGSGSFDPSSLIGLATEAWVDENYLSIEFFSQLFKAYKPGESAGDPDVEVLPNTIDEDITNVKSMFGFWTEFYLSALGTGGASSVGISLASLSDVDVTGVTNGQFLKWDSMQLKWVPGTASGGTDMATVWANLAAVDATHQIDASHLTTAAASLSVNYANTANYANYVYCTSHIGTWYLSSDWDGTYFWLTGKYNSNTVPCATAYATSAGSASTASSASYATSAGSATSAGYAGYLSVYNKTIWGQTYWNSSGQPQNVSGDLILNGSNLGLYGTPGWSNSCYISGYYSSGYKIGFAVGGTAVVEISSAGVYSTSGVTALSDIRFKDVVEWMDIDVKRIAEMSIIKFLWNDRDEGGKLHVGCIAQEWEGLLPWTVQEVNGKKSLDYSVAALVSVVAVARKVESHEERIARLERELVKERALLSKESGRKGD